MKWTFLFLLTTIGGMAQAKVIVGATTQDVEALVRVVGGGEVETFSVAKGTQDPHQIEAKPSFMVKFRSAELIVAQGLELETAWLTPLIQGSRNPGIVAGSKGFLELGPLLDPIEVSKGSVSRGEGDIHPNGNPHFQLDPIRLGKSAVLIAERLGEIDGAHKNLYHTNALGFQKRMEEKAKAWKARIDKTGIKEFVSYHKTFSYFADRFGLKNTLYLEPKPGIPPTASHIIQVIEEMKSRSVHAVLIENFFDDSVRAKLSNELPAVKVAKVPVYVGGEDSVKTNEELIEMLVRTLESMSK
jgi:zinc/manganese transport system substrate-binding protein